MRSRFVPIFVAVGLALISTGIGWGRVKAKDFFPSGPPLAMAEAAAAGRVEKIDQLVNAGADVNARGNEGMTALIWALMHQNKKGYQYLLEHGADPNLQIGTSSLTSDGLIDGNAAVSLAAMHEDPWYLEMALKHRGNPNIWNPVKGVTPVFQCIMLLDRRSPRPRLEQLKLLIAAGADLNARDRDGYTPMVKAAWLNRYDLIYQMLVGGADPRQKMIREKTIASHIRDSHTDPKSELYQWRAKVIEFLKGRGFDIEVEK
jgi:ankyrin repeat protein